jgi:hypothetical protein
MPIPQPRWYSYLDATASDRIFLCYQDLTSPGTHFLRSFDHGQSFETDTLDIIVMALRAGDDEVVVGDVGKSFHRSEDAFTLIHEDPVAQESASGLTIFPTPFSDRLKVEFVTKHDAWAEIVLYDLAGRRVDELLAGPVGVGSHRFGLDTRRLSQSVYFYTARIGERLYRGKLTKISP